jgi:hypothetical protein
MPKALRATCRTVTIGKDKTAGETTMFHQPSCLSVSLFDPVYVAAIIGTGGDGRGKGSLISLSDRPGQVAGFGLGRSGRVAAASDWSDRPDPSPNLTGSPAVRVTQVADGIGSALSEPPL